MYLNPNRDEVRAVTNIFIRGVNIFVFRFQNGKQEILTSEGYKEYKPFEHVDATVSIYEEIAQQLFDDLWDSGFRPKKPDEYAAKDEHIEDLRKVAFKLLDIDK